MFPVFLFIFAHRTRCIWAFSTLPLANNQRADSGSHLGQRRRKWKPLMCSQRLADTQFVIQLTTIRWCLWGRGTLLPGLGISSREWGMPAEPRPLSPGSTTDWQWCWWTFCASHQSIQYLVSSTKTERDSLNLLHWVLWVKSTQCTNPKKLQPHLNN